MSIMSHTHTRTHILTPWAPVGAKNRILNMDTGFEKLFVKRGHPSDKVIDGELLYVVL